MTMEANQKVQEINVKLNSKLDLNLNPGMH